MNKRESVLPMPSALELQRIARLTEASRLAGVSQDTLRRHYRHLLIEISPRCLGMRVGDALRISKSA